MPLAQQNKILDWSLTGVAVVFGSVAFALSIVAGQTKKPNWWLIGIGITSTAITLLVAAIEKHRTNQLREQTERLARETEASHELMISSLTPCVRHGAIISGLLATMAPLDTQRGRLDQSVTVAAAGIALGGRGMFYEYDPGADEFTLRAEWPGGARSKFLPGDPEHTMMKAVATSGLIFKRNNSPSPFKDPGSGTAPPPEAIAAIRVSAGNKVIGVLAIDAEVASWSTGATGFSDRNIRQLLMLADLLAAGLKP